MVIISVLKKTPIFGGHMKTLSITLGLILISSVCSASTYTLNEAKCNLTNGTLSYSSAVGHDNKAAISFGMFKKEFETTPKVEVAIAYGERVGTWEITDATGINYEIEFAIGQKKIIQNALIENAQTSVKFNGYQVGTGTCDIVISPL